MRHATGPGHPDDCPCGSGKPYQACCGPFHTAARQPATAEQLMRARYSAYAVHHEAFLLVTWLPTTRPARISFDPELVWTGLDILAASEGTPFHREGTVEFVASYEVRHRGRTTTGTLHEVSRFLMSDRWLYVDGAVGRRP